MKQYRLVRPELKATASQELPVSDLIESWLEELSDLEPEIGEDASSLFRFVGLVCKLDRAGVKTLPIKDTPTPRGFLEALAPEEYRKLIELIDGSSWRAEVSEFGYLEQSDQLDLDTIYEWGSDLLDEFDDIQLVGRMALQKIDQPEFLHELERCNRWLFYYADSFLYLSSYIQMLAATVAKESWENPYGPWQGTYSTLDSLLDMLEEKELLEDDSHPQIELALEKEPPHKIEVVPSSTQEKRIPSLGSELALSFSGTKQLPFCGSMSWLSPDKKCQAELRIPQVVPESKELYLILKPKEKYVGKWVILGGLRGQVDAKGRVKFHWDEISAVEEKLDHLQVGSGPSWIRQQ